MISNNRGGKPLYIIKKDPDASSSIFDDIVNHLKKYGYLEQPSTIEIKDNVIYFQHNLKEISVLIYDIVEKIFDYQRYSNVNFFRKRKIPPGFNEFWIFENKCLKLGTGIIWERYQSGSVLARAKEIRKVGKTKYPADNFGNLNLKDNSLNPKSSVTFNEQIADEISKHNGICFGEAHNSIEHKKMLISTLRILARNHVQDLFVEFGFYDTQNHLYSHFHSTGIMPNTLLAYLMKEDSNMGMTASASSDPLVSYQSQPFSYLGIVVMAQMLGMKITPIDHTDAYDSIFMYLEKGEEKFGYKRALTMNPTAASIVNANKREKYITFTGDNHNKTDYQLGAPGISALLEVPHFPLRNFSTQDECDVYTKALLIHNIHRVLFGKPVKVYSAPKSFLLHESDTSRCQKLIFLQELKSDLENIKWSDKTLLSLKSRLDAINHFSNSKDIDKEFDLTLQQLSDACFVISFSSVAEEEPQKMQYERKAFYLDKFLQGKDILDLKYRRFTHPETCPAILNVPINLLAIQNVYEMLRIKYLETIRSYESDNRLDQKKHIESLKQIKTEFIKFIQDHLTEIEGDERSKILDAITEWEKNKVFIKHFRKGVLQNLFIDTDSWKELKGLLSKPSPTNKDLTFRL